MQTQYNVFCYRGFNLYFHDCNLSIEIDENGHSGRNIDCWIKRQKAIKQELSCKFIWIDPGKEDFNIMRAMNEIFRNIKQST